MKFDASEVLEINDMGELDGDKIKCVALKGGLNIVVRSKGDQSQVLASASHPAIARFAIKKAFPNFRASLMKSESNETPMKDYSNLLPEVMLKSGYGLAAVYENAYTTTYNIMRHNIFEYSVMGINTPDSIILSKTDLYKNEDAEGNNIPYPHIAQVSTAIVNAAIKDGIKAGKNTIEFFGKKFPIKQPTE